MKNYGSLGPAAPEFGWVPAPRYLLRRSLLLSEFESITPCDTLEIGPGAGALLHELTDRGFRCIALESSEPARALAGSLAAEANKPIRFVSAAEQDWEERFDLLMAFEVLEHIEDDAAALAAWHKWMRQGATLLLSVPSHMVRWNPSDVWAGHFRRYERRELANLLESTGFRVSHIWCYGFPLASLGEWYRAAKAAPEVNAARDTTLQGKKNKTDLSGIDRRHSLSWFPIYESLPGRAALRIADFMQRRFLGTELGNGYLVRAIRT